MKTRCWSTCCSCLVIRKSSLIKPTVMPASHIYFKLLSRLCCWTQTILLSCFRFGSLASSLRYLYIFSFCTISSTHHIQYYPLYASHLYTPPNHVGCAGFESAGFGDDFHGKCNRTC